MIKKAMTSREMNTGEDVNKASTRGKQDTGRTESKTGNRRQVKETSWGAMDKKDKKKKGRKAKGREGSTRAGVGKVCEGER